MEVLQIQGWSLCLEYIIMRSSDYFSPNIGTLICTVWHQTGSGRFISCISSGSHKCLMVRVNAAGKGVENLSSSSHQTSVWHINNMKTEDMQLIMNKKQTCNMRRQLVFFSPFYFSTLLDNLLFAAWNYAAILPTTHIFRGWLFYWIYAWLFLKK